MFRLIFILSLVLSTLGLAQEISLPEGCKVTGSVLRSPEGFMIAEGEKGPGFRLDGPVADSGMSLILKGKTGKRDPGIVIDLTTRAGKRATLLIRAMDVSVRGEVFPDAYIGVGRRGVYPEGDPGVKRTGGWARYFVRPNPVFYKREEFEKRREKWHKLPGASEHSFCVEIRPTARHESEVWVDGQFIQLLPVADFVESYRVTLKPGSLLESFELVERVPSDKRALPVAQHARSGSMIDAVLAFDPSVPEAAMFSEATDKRGEGIAVGGLGVFTGLASSDLQSLFWQRHASHALPEQRMFSVPLATYSHAYVLCAMEEGTQRADAFTLRVTRYGGSRGDAMADTIVKVPAGRDDTANPGARRVGSVTYGPEGERKTVALWVVKVPVRNGIIQDLLYEDTFRDRNVGISDYLDVELLDPLENVEDAYVFPPPMEHVQRAWQPTPTDASNYDYRWPAPVTSGVTVFGLTLEESPATMKVEANPRHQVFYASENPEFIAQVNAARAGEYLLQWEMADVGGRIVASGESAVELESGADRKITLPVKQGIGWYACRFRLSEAARGELLDYRTTFVMLPPDERKAGFESPFYGWWFKKNQRSDVKLDEVGPLLQRLGMRRAGLSPNDEMPERLSKKYGFTEAAVGWANRESGRHALRQFRDGKITLSEAVAKHEAYIRKCLELWPGIDRMLVFHEDTPAGAPFPSELWGEPAPDFSEIEDENSPEALLRKEGGGTAGKDEKAKAEWEANWPKRIEYLTAMSAMVREKFPQLKMQFGNDGNSLGTMGELFRRQFPKQWIDTLSVEDLGQSFAPERALIGGLHSAWFLRETARKMGYGDVPVTACPEWIGRMTERLGLKAQAEWKVRDGLLALAYGFDTISIGGINDASSGYYHTVWASGGVTTRYPTMAPKPSYAAVATLTQVLDQAEFQRFVPTQSPTLYAQEYRRDGEWIYVFWTPRGVREMTLKFAEESGRRLIDLYGREMTVSGASVPLTAGTAPQYLISGTRIGSATAGAASFPEDQAPGEPLKVIPVESLEEISVAPRKRDEEWSVQRPWVIPQKREAQVELREVDDPEMGRCLEVELIPQGELWEMTHEYVYLKLKKGVRTNARNAGIWIKGNGSWGQVDIWKDRPWGPWLSNANRRLLWPGDATLNFEGWNFIRYPYYDWQRESETEVQGIMLTLPRHVLYGTEMAPVENLKVRIKSIVLF